MKILVCGGRNYADKSALYAVLNRVIQLTGVASDELIIIQGGARGTDSLARQWAELSGIHCATVPALWSRYGKIAGHKRNAAMRDLLRPDLCVTFPGGSGTADMVRKCELEGVPIWFAKNFPTAPVAAETINDLRNPL